MTVAYHLQFRSPVHFGIEGIGQESIEETLRSDTLWGAILQKWFLLYDDEPGALCGHAPFIVSSCFPVIGGVRFFPLPIGALDTVMENAARASRPDTPTVKQWKRVRYVAEPLFRRILGGVTLQLSDVARDQVYPMPQHRGQPDTSVTPYQREERPRIRTDQMVGGVNKGDFFYCTDQYFEAGSGLFFLAEFENQTALSKFEAALRLLGDTGVGADRSTGRGCFTFDRADIQLPRQTDSVTWLTLSLYHPTRDEVARGVLNGSASRYSLVKRSGSGGSLLVNRYRRADCWMLAEGAVLPFRVRGDAPRVIKRSELIPHDVYRNGHAFCIPFPGGKS